MQPDVVNSAGSHKLDACFNWVPHDPKKQEEPQPIKHTDTTAAPTAAYENPVKQLTEVQEELIIMDVEAPRGQAVNNISGFWHCQSNLGLCQGRDKESPAFHSA